jgi:hypothetical protein
VVLVRTLPFRAPEFDWGENLVLFGCSFGSSRCFFSSRSFLGCSLFSRCFFSGRCRSAALFFKLEAQGIDDACSSGCRSLEDTGNTCKLELAGLEGSQCGDTLSVQCLAFEQAGLDDQLLVGLGKVRQALCSSNGVALDEGDRSGAGELAVECIDTSFLGWRSGCS